MSGSSLFLTSQTHEWLGTSQLSFTTCSPAWALSHLRLLTVPGMIETNCPWRRSWTSSMFPAWTPPRAASPSTPGFRYGGNCDLGILNITFQTRCYWSLWENWLSTHPASLHGKSYRMWTCVSRKTKKRLNPDPLKLCFLFFIINVHWSIVDLQCCVSAVQQSESVICVYTHTHTHTHIHPF